VTLKSHIGLTTAALGGAVLMSMAAVHAQAPASAAQAHIGHVMTSWKDTPMRRGSFRPLSPTHRSRWSKSSAPISKGASTTSGCMAATF
jgi:hypothetical protein